MRWPALAVAIFAVGLAGCIIDPGANPAAEACRTSGDCPSGICRRGFCLGSTADGGVDTTLCEGAQEGQRYDCYTGPAGTEGVGACRPGEVACFEGLPTPCLGQVLPGIEICNGKDDDCNGTVDDFPEASCERPNQLGVCARGILVCRDDAAQCAAAVEPTIEICNGEDDDCDGEVDEDADVPCFPSGEQGCTADGDGFACLGVCKPGLRRCIDGALEATCTGAVTPGAMDGCTPMDELARDDDCDGVVDQDCECTPNQTQACYNGPEGTMDVGACRPGEQTCEAGPSGNRFGTCEDQVLPALETCGNPNRDDDCDGMTDNVPGVGQPCENLAAQGICRNGTRSCVSGVLTCVTSEARAEICNTLDDDCDGTVDNGFTLATDPNHCGSCGNACGQGETCCAGACVRVASSPDHCGTCGNACGEGLTCCGGACTDLQNTKTSCGLCGRSCGMGESCREGCCCRGNQCSC